MWVLCRLAGAGGRKQNRETIGPVRHRGEAGGRCRHTGTHIFAGFDADDFRVQNSEYVIILIAIK